MIALLTREVGHRTARLQVSSASLVIAAWGMSSLPTTAREVRSKTGSTRNSSETRSRGAAASGFTAAARRYLAHSASAPSALSAVYRQPYTPWRFHLPRARRMYPA